MSESAHDSLLEFRRKRFAVEVKPTEFSRNPGEVTMSVTHNGNHWQSIDLLPEEVVRVREALGRTGRMLVLDESKPDLRAHIQALVAKHALSVESLTEEQLVEVLRQAFASGDFVRVLQCDNRTQTVVYLPWREAERLRRQYEALLFAVERVHEGESRHETALRYIREREASQGSETL